jgi:hypothetical protein
LKKDIMKMLLKLQGRQDLFAVSYRSPILTESESY